MSSRVRVVLNTTKLSAEQIITMAGTVINGLTDNPAFPTPTVDLKTVQAASAALEAALAAQSQGGPAATADKNNKREALIELLRKLKLYVEDNCGNDLAVLLSSGFQAASANRASTPLDTPLIPAISLGNSGEMVLKVTRIARAKCYQVRSAVVGAGGVLEAWKTVCLSSDSRLMKVANLVPGTTYAFQVRAIGGSTGYSDWSNPVTRMCA